MQQFAMTRPRALFRRPPRAREERPQTLFGHLSLTERELRLATLPRLPKPMSAPKQVRHWQRGSFVMLAGGTA